MKKTLVLTIAAAGSVAFGAGELDRALLIGTTDRNPFSYEIGDEVTFTIRFEHAKPFPEGAYVLDWLREGDDGEKASGKAPLVYGQPVVLKTRIGTNGFVRIKSFVRDRKGNRYKRQFTDDGLTPEGKKAMNPWEKKGAQIMFVGAAAAHPETMRSVPEPDDFDAFWAKRRSALAAVPMKADLKEHPSDSPSTKVYSFSIACAGPRPVTGTLTVPTKPGKYPAEITFHGYSKDFVQTPPKHGHTDRLFMFINAHGYELGREPEYYKAFYESVKSNGHHYGTDPVQNADPDKAYFSGMTYRIMRALEYLKSRPEWDGKNLSATGGSMGGLQSIWAGALDPDVTKVSALVPWCCDMGGRVTLHRFYPGSPKETVALRYFDPVNLAKRIPKTTWVDIPRAGLGDESSPPNGVSVLWNNLNCRKSIRWVQGSTHGEEPPKEFREEYVWKDGL